MSAQPIAIKIFLYVSILLWGVQIPLGGANIGAQLLVTILAGSAVGFRKQLVSKRVLIFSGFLTLYGAFSFFSGPCIDGMTKVVGSLIAFVLVLISLSWLASAVRYDEPLVSSKEISAMLWIMIFFALGEFLIYFFYGAGFYNIRVGGLYSEPSLLALSAAPLLFFLWHAGLKFKAALFFMAFLFVSYSSTLIILLVMMTVLSYAGGFLRKRMRISDIFAIFGVIVAAIFSLSVFSDSDTFLRISDLVDLRQESNLSSLVYANGWQQMASYLTTTYGVGLGANAMGCSPIAHTTITEWLELLELGGQNASDGSFLLSKIGSEFGLLGIVFFLYIALFSARKLFRISSRSSSLEIIAVAWLAVVALGGFVRTAGYFSGPVFLGVFAYFVLRASNKQCGYLKKEHQ